MADEHEAGSVVGRAMETLSALLRLAGGAIANTRETVAGLEVGHRGHGQDLELTGGILLSERVVLALAPKSGRAEATRAVREAAVRCQASGGAFIDELLDDPT